MRKSFRIGFALAPVLLFGASVLVHAEVSEGEASAIASAYAAALKSGDVAGLEALVGGQLLERRSSLWNSPGYAQELVDTYGHSEIVIGTATRGDNGTISVLLTIAESGQALVKRLTVADTDAGPRIVDERVAVER